jgi:hypothetical protein
MINAIEDIELLENCPPEDSFQYNGEIFVFVKNDPPSSNDFKTACDKGLYPNADQCLRQALSCGQSMKYLDSILSLFPVTKGWKKAKGYITSKDGVFKQTSGNKLHYSFWIQKQTKLNLNSKFKVI